MINPAPPVALYVHLPFCVSHCPYCDFVVYSGGDARGPRARPERTYGAIERELVLRADALDERFGRPGPGGTPPEPGATGDDRGDAPARLPLETVYFGGGTPSLIAGEWLERLMAVIHSRFGVSADAEVTLEANPGADERGDLTAFRHAGVTRISFGAQSLDAGELRRLGRRHSPQDVASSLSAARAAGIGSVNLDLLYDVPGQSLAGWNWTLGAALAMEPDHLSLYGLTLDDPDAEGITGAGGDHLPTPPGARKWRERARVEQDDDRAADQYEMAAGILAAAGWRGYEISNWARPGHEGRHNLVYWQRRPYEAVGPGAHAFDGVLRRWNAAHLLGYVGALLPAHGPSKLPPGGIESITPDVAASEEVILALRLDRGVRASFVDDPAAPPTLAATFDWARSLGLIETVDLDGVPHLRLTVRGRLLSNELFQRLL